MNEVFKKYYLGLLNSSKGDIIYSEIGYLDRSSLEVLLFNLEEKLYTNPLTKSIARKLYIISVEMLQNIFHHGQNDETNKKSFSFFITKEESCLKIITLNIVNNSDKKIIKEKIDFVNKLRKDEVKDLYLQVLNDRQFTEKGGGSLGIIDIRRKSKEKLVYSFKKLDSSKFIFIFEVSVNVKKKKKNEVFSY